MEYVGKIIRPPSEANSIILQATIGCSHNKCTFCGAYKEKRFTIKEWPRLIADLEFAAIYCRRQTRLFLGDGDALIMPYPILRDLFEEIRHRLSWVRRISLYGSARSIRSKSVDELRHLRALGLDRVYLGLESGDDEVLQNIQKGESGQNMIDCARKVNEAGLFLSVTVLLGIAGVSGSCLHATRTARVLKEMRPRQIAALTYMPLANTSLGHDCISGIFTLPDAHGMMEELKVMLEHLDVNCQFHANHASNYLPISGRLPRDKGRILAEIGQAISGDRVLVPESSRRL